MDYSYIFDCDLVSRKQCTFELTEEQRVNRLNFANFHLQNNTNWSNVLFVDESAFYLDNSHRWVWRRRGEFDEKLV